MKLTRRKISKLERLVPLTTAPPHSAIRATAWHRRGYQLPTNPYQLDPRLSTAQLTISKRLTTLGHTQRNKKLLPRTRWVASGPSDSPKDRPVFFRAAARPIRRSPARNSDQGV